MTKILGVLYDNAACLATDRLVSRGGVAFDRAANKNLLYSAPDATVLLAYTGSAYIENLPTDEWIARSITGVQESSPPLPGTPRGAGTWAGTMVNVGGAQFPRWLPLENTLARLRQDLDDVRPDLLAGNAQLPTIVACGIRWDPETDDLDAGSFVAFVRPGGATYVVDLHSREQGSACTFDLVEAPLPAEVDVEKATALLSRAPTMAAVEDGLVSLIRNASMSSPGTVGADVMTMGVQAAEFSHPRIKCHPSSSSGGWVTSRLGPPRRERIDVMYTPWMIGSLIAASPEAVMGLQQANRLSVVNVASGVPADVIPQWVDVPSPRPGSTVIGASTSPPARKINPRPQPKRKPKPKGKRRR